MEGFTLIDGIVAVIVVVSAILAYSRGFVREGLAIGGWIAAAIAAYYFAPTLEPLIAEIPIEQVRNLLDNCELGTIAAFFVVLVGGLIITSIFTPLFAGAVQRSFLSGLDQGLGFLFGVLRGVLLVVIALVIYDRVVISDPIPMIEDSRTVKLFESLTTEVNDQIPEEAPGWITARYNDLIAHCSGTPVGSDT